MGKKLFFVFLFGLLLYVSLPLLLPVTMGAILAVLFYPWLIWLERRNIARGIGSALISFGMTLLLLVPSVILIFIGARAGMQQLRLWKYAPNLADGQGFVEKLVNSPVIHHAIEKITTWFPIEVSELANATMDLARGIGLRIADALGTFLAHLPSLALGIVVMVISTYFFLVDGRKLSEFIRRNSFLEPQQTERLMSSFSGICRSVILATVISGVVQASIFSIACIVFGVGNTAVIGLAVFLTSFIPLVGAVPVTFGVALHQILIGNRAAGVVLFCAAVFVALIDNVIRPAVLKGSANLHPLLAFVAVFGGLHVFGFPGVFLGPIIAALSMTALNSLVSSRKGIGAGTGTGREQACPTQTQDQTQSRTQNASLQE